MRQPPKQEWFHIFFPFTFFDSFLVVLYLAKVSFTTGGTRRYLNPTEDTQAVQFHQDGFNMCHCQKVCCVCQQSQEHGGDSRRQAVILGVIDRVVIGQQDSYLLHCASRYSVRATIDLRSDLQQASGVNVSDQNITDYMRVL